MLAAVRTASCKVRECSTSGPQRSVTPYISRRARASSVVISVAVNEQFRDAGEADV